MAASRFLLVSRAGLTMCFFPPLLKTVFLFPPLPLWLVSGKWFASYHHSLFRLTPAKYMLWYPEAQLTLPWVSAFPPCGSRACACLPHTILQAPFFFFLPHIGRFPPLAPRLVSPPTKTPQGLSAPSTLGGLAEFPNLRAFSVFPPPQYAYE